MSTGNVEVTMPSDREISVIRTFDAPRQLVFDAFTKAELVKRWAYGPDDWPIIQCEIDFRVGGTFRYVWHNKETGNMVMGGSYREITAPERIVHTELFEEDWTGGETLVTTLFEEQNGRTTVTVTVLYSSNEAREVVLKSGMIEGWGQTYARLAELLASLSPSMS